MRELQRTEIFLMATTSDSTVLFDNVDRLLTTFIPVHSNILHDIGIKSHGTITCMIRESFSFSYFSFFFKFPIINLIEQNLFACHLMHLLDILKNCLVKNGVTE